MPFTYGSVFSAEARNGKGKKSKKKGFEEYLLVAFVVTTVQTMYNRKSDDRKSFVRWPLCGRRGSKRRQRRQFPCKR